jgi:CDP-glucose 4,6-dehydratase
VPDVIAALHDGRVELRHPEAVRPWQHVLNVVDGYLLLAERLWEHRAFARAWNFAPDPGDVLSVGQVVERLAGAWEGALVVVPPRQAYPPEAPSLRLDATRARELLGWEPRWNLDRALESIVEWYRAYAAGESVAEVTVGQIRAYASERGALPLSR